MGTSFTTTVWHASDPTTVETHHGMRWGTHIKARNRAIRMWHYRNQWFTDDDGVIYVKVEQDRRVRNAEGHWKAGVKETGGYWTDSMSADDYREDREEFLAMAGLDPDGNDLT